MHKTLAAGIVLALAAGSAEAVMLNPRGTGEVLIYPYYTVNGGVSTALSVVNTTNAGKAVKVRFREGLDGRGVLYFNLYLSPYDVWVGQVAPVGFGAGVFSNDNSCTVPALPKTAADAVPFMTLAFDGSLAEGTDGGPTNVARTREGWVEVIEMGEVTQGTQHTLAAITHGHTGVPSNCAQLVSAWGAGGYWSADASVDMAPATGGLAGSGLIVNVGLGTVEGYAAQALSGFYTAGTASTHSLPGDEVPNLSTGTSKASTVVVGDAGLTLTFDRAVDAVSAVFMSSRLSGEYWKQPSIGAQTEWVLTSPTKPYYTDPQYVGASALKPFDVPFAAPTQASGTAGSCSTATPTVIDREELLVDPSSGLPGAPAVTIALCAAAQVVGFGETHSQVLQSATFASAPNVPFLSGWQIIDIAPVSGRATTAHKLVDSASNILYGQPTIGVTISQFVNGDLGGVRSNYTLLEALPSALDCDRGTAAQPCS